LSECGDDATEGQSYLDRIASAVTAPVNAVPAQGTPADALARLARKRGISHVVMTSHGRTGLSRMIAGDVAADLIERLSRPIVVIPSLAHEAEQRSQSETLAAETGTTVST